MGKLHKRGWLGKWSGGGQEAVPAPENIMVVVIAHDAEKR
jgi:hypothetical protein